MDKKRYFIGIDGGGTKTDVAVCDSEGNVIYRKKSSGCNPSNIGLDNTVKLLQTALTEAYAGAGICQKKDETFVFIGAAGCGVGNNAAVVRGALQETAANVWVDSDIVNVIQTGLQGENGIAVIAGTGSLIAAYKDGAVFKFGGNGFLFEEGGSGFSLGRDGLIAAFNDIDGVGEKTLLTEYITQRLGKNPKDARGELCKQTPDYIGSFAALVSKAYKNGDKAAINIVQKNMESILRFVKRARQELTEEKPKAAFVGGIFKDEIYREYIADKIGKEYRLAFTQVPPVCGALRQAACLAGENVDTAFMYNVEKTVKE